MKHKARRTKKSTVLNVFICLIVVFILVLASLLLFQTRTIRVSGIEYSQESDVLNWIHQDRFAINSLYIVLRYGNVQADLPPGVESVQAVLRSPWKVELVVTEKTLYGYVETPNAQLVYFDRHGVVSLISHDHLPDVWFIEGLEVDEANIRLNEPLPVVDDGIFRRIVEVSDLLELYNLVPDRVATSEGNINLFFGGVMVQLGNRSFEDRVAQIPPILERLTAQYPQHHGVLHLENFERGAHSIRFVPENRLVPEPEPEAESEDGWQQPEDGWQQPAPEYIPEVWDPAPEYIPEAVQDVVPEPVTEVDWNE